MVQSGFTSICRVLSSCFGCRGYCLPGCRHCFDLFDNLSKLVAVEDQGVHALMFHSDSDEVIPVSHAQAMYDRLCDLGGAAHLFIVDGAPHDMFPVMDPTYFRILRAFRQRTLEHDAIREAHAAAAYPLLRRRVGPAAASTCCGLRRFANVFRARDAVAVVAPNIAQNLSQDASSGDHHLTNKRLLSPHGEELPGRRPSDATVGGRSGSISSARSRSESVGGERGIITQQIVTEQPVEGQQPATRRHVSLDRSQPAQSHVNRPVIKAAVEALRLLVERGFLVRVSGHGLLRDDGALFQFASATPERKRLLPG